MGIFSKRDAQGQPPERSSMVDLTKKAAVSLDKTGLSGHRAAVYLVLDHSGSMGDFYRDGDVQRLAQQTLGLAVNLDDDGEVPVIYFSDRAEQPVMVSLDSYQGAVERTYKKVLWGGTSYVPAMTRVLEHYRASGATDPALVVFQTDGTPQDQKAVEKALREYSHLPVFWAFVGFGPKWLMEFLTKLDDLSGRAVDNASFFHAAEPRNTTDEALYDGITGQYAGWLAEARRAGIVA